MSSEPATTRPASLPERRFFGTDGMRAPYGTPPLDEPTVTALAIALGRTLRERGETAEDGGPPEVLLGGDTRLSTATVCRWVAAGLAAGGVRHRYLGVVPTPAVARLARQLHAAGGAVVSASHNPLPDNGVKLFTAEGDKWSPRDEADLEGRMAEILDAGDAKAAPSRVALDADEAAVALYVDHLAGAVPPWGRHKPLDGLRIALDCANGAASAIAPEVFRRLGADVRTVCAEPDGENINRGCGSNHPQGLVATVKAGRCDLGFAFDGDADRAVLVDEKAGLRDGDAILYLWALALREAGRLEPAAVVATSMSNLGLERSLAEHGIRVRRCDVGDRAVVETLRRHGLKLGGEQSGHVVNLELSTTGDGLLTALQVSARVASTGRSASELLAGFRRFPQVLRNVPVTSKPDLDGLPTVAAAARRVEDALGDDGRLVLRYSGTEPLARVMIEGPEQERIEALAADLAAAIQQEVGQP